MSHEPEYFVNGERVTAGEFVEGLAGTVRRHEHDGVTPAHYMGDGVTAGEALRSMLEAPPTGTSRPWHWFGGR